MSAAIYASRSNMKTLMLGAPGGQLMNTEEIENYPGFSHISGSDLAMQMYEHCQKFGAEVRPYAMVDSIEPRFGGTFNVSINEQEEIFETKSVIIATGTKYKKLGVPGEDKLTGAGVSWCAVCDGAFYKNKEIVVVGGGDSAVEEAIYLTKFASKVTLVHRRDKFRAQPILVDRMLKNDKIEIVYDTIVKEIIGDKAVEAVVLENLKTGVVGTLPTSGVFEYVGMNPVTDFVPRDLSILDNDGWIVTNNKMETSVPGIFAVGDVRQDAVRQVVVATGDGCIAALRAQHYVENNF